MTLQPNVQRQPALFVPFLEVHIDSKPHSATSHGDELVAAGSSAVVSSPGAVVLPTVVGRPWLAGRHDLYLSRSSGSGIGRKVTRYERFITLLMVTNRHNSLNGSIYFMFYK